MDDLLLDGVVVRKLNDELSAGASWNNCTLIARPRVNGCSLQLKIGKCVCISYLFTLFSVHVSLFVIHQ